jgi:hypothetical protein
LGLENEEHAEMYDQMDKVEKKMFLRKQGFQHFKKDQIKKREEEEIALVKNP